MESIKLIIKYLFKRDVNTILHVFTRAQDDLQSYAKSQAKKAEKKAEESVRLLDEARDIDNEVRRALNVCSNLKKLCGGDDGRDTSD